MGKIKDETLKLDIIVNGNKAQKALGELEQSNRKLKNSSEDLRKAKQLLLSQNKKGGEEWKKLTKQITENNTKVKANKSKMAGHRKELGLVGLTTKQLRKEQRRLNQVLDDATPNTPAYKKYEAQLQKVNGRLGELKASSKATGKTVDALETGFADLSNVWQGMSTGNIPLLQQGLRGVAGNIKAITRAGLAFIATPIGLAIVGLAAIALGTKKWVDFNLEVEKSNKLVRDITQLSGDAVDSIRMRAEVLQEAFGADTQKTITTAKSLVDNLGVSYNEAFDIIEDGAIRGKLRNEEFLDSLKEYPVQFKNAGFSAKEFGAIVNAGIDLSIYKDKLPDAIKEFVLSVTEQTPAAKKALEDAFGKKFTHKLFSDLKKGAILPKEALALISGEAKKIGLNSKKAQVLTADLFKGAGEDAGGALKIFEAVNMALNGQARPLTEIQKLQADQLEQTKKLKGIYTSLFATADGGMGKMISKGKIFATKTLIKILETGVAVYNWFVDLNNQSGAFSAILTGIGKSAGAGFSVFFILLKQAWGAVKGLGNVVTGIFTLNPSKIKEGFSQGMSAILDTSKKIKDKVVDDAKDIYAAFSGKNKAKRINLDTFFKDDVSKKENTTKGTTNNGLSEKQKATNAAFKAAEEELTKIIAKQKAERLINSKSNLEKELAQIDAKYASMLKKAEGHATATTELETLRDKEKADLKLLKETETAQRIKELEEENYIEKEAQRLEREALAAETDEEKTLLLLERTQWIANEQLRIEQEKELARLALAGATEKEIAAIKVKFALKQAKADTSFEKGKKALKTQEVAWTGMTEGQKFNLVKDGLGQAAELFNKHTAAYKAIKIAETTMTTYQSAVSSYNSLSGIPIVGPALGAVAAAAAVASGIATVRKIAATKKEGFEDGYYPITRTDGKKFNAKLSNSSHTQMVTEPTYFSDGDYLAGEAGPEIIIDTPTLRNLDPGVIDKIYASAARTRGFETGLYKNNEATTEVDSLEVANNEYLIQVLNLIAERLSEPLIATALIGDSEIAELEKRTQKLKQNRQNAKIT